MPSMLLLCGAAMAQAVPPEIRKPKDEHGPAHVSVVASTAMVGLGIETPVGSPKIEAVGLRGGVGPAIDLGLDTGGALMFGTFAAPYVRFGSGRVHAEGYVGPAALFSSGVKAAFVSGAAMEFDVSESLSLRVGGASYVSLRTAFPRGDVLEEAGNVGLSPELGVVLRW